MAVTASVSTSSVVIFPPVETSYSRMTRSSAADASILPFGEYATEVTCPVCPLSVVIFLPVETSHSCTVPSHDPVATVLPSCENTTEETLSVCPSSVVILWPVFRCHIWTVALLSNNPTATSALSGENATDEMLGIICLPSVTIPLVETSHSRRVSSHAPTSNRCAIGRKRDSDTPIGTWERSDISILFRRNIPQFGSVIECPRGEFCPVW